MDITEFIASVSAASGFARPNKYRVDIAALPVIITNNSFFQDGGYFKKFLVDSVDIQKRISLLAHRAEFPSKFFATTEIRHYGPTYKQPYEAIYDDVRVQFLITGEFDEKLFFDSWHYAIEDAITLDYNYYSEYTTDIGISQFDESDNIIYEITLQNAWPNFVGNLELDYSPNNQVHSLVVGFSYRRWIVAGINGITDSNGDTMLSIDKIQFSKNEPQQKTQVNSTISYNLTPIK